MRFVMALVLVALFSRGEVQAENMLFDGTLNVNVANLESIKQT